MWYDVVCFRGWEVVPMGRFDPRLNLAYAEQPLTPPSPPQRRKGVRNWSRSCMVAERWILNFPTT